MAIPPLWVLAVVLSCLVSTFTVLGFVLQTRAVRDPSQRSRYPRLGEVVISPCWVLGVLLQAVPNFVGDAVVYTIAPLSLTAPLSGFSVALNTSLAPWLLGERLHRWPDLPATALILLGLVLTTGAGPHQDRRPVAGPAAVCALASRPLVLGLLAGLLASLCACVGCQLLARQRIERDAQERFEAPRLWDLLLPAWSAAGAGCVTNVGMKVFGEFLAAGAPGAQVLGAFWLGVAPAALVQQQCVNRGLRLYPQTVFFPIYSSLLVLSNTLLGGLFFEEYLALAGEDREIAGFGGGLLIILAGIVLFSRRRSKASAPAPGLQEALL